MTTPSPKYVYAARQASALLRRAQTSLRSQCMSSSKQMGAIDLAFYQAIHAALILAPHNTNSHRLIRGIKAKAIEDIAARLIDLANE